MASSSNFNHSHRRNWTTPLPLFAGRRRQTSLADLDDNWRTSRPVEERVGIREPELDTQDHHVMEEEFQGGVDLGHFWTSNVTPPEEEMDFSRPPASVLPFPQLRALVGRRMELIGASSVLCFGPDGDRALYKADRNARFDAWLKRNKERLLSEQREGEGPYFIVKGGGKILTTPLRPLEKWGVFVIRIEDFIFLKKYEPKEDTDAGPKLDSKEQPQQEQCVRIPIPRAEIFKRIAIGQEPTSHGFNQFEEPVTIRKVTVGTPKHNLLILRVGHYLDESGQKVMVRSDTDSWEWLFEGDVTFMQKRYLGFWTTAVLGGIDAVIMGHRDKEGRITGVDRLTPDDIWKVISHGKRQQGIKSRCFQFLQKFLDQVKSEFPSSDPEIMKKFEWDPELKELKCQQLVNEELRKAREKLTLDWLL